MNYKTKPYKHQASGSQLLIDSPLFCLGDEMGTGKTKTVIDAQCALAERGIIEAVLIVCPNSVKTNYGDPEKGQLVQHGWDTIHHQVHVLKTGMKFHPVENFPGNTLHWIIVNYESVWRTKTEAWLKQFMKRFKTTMVLDESHSISDWTTMQAKGCHRLGPLAARRIIMSGTLITTNPLNYWSQFKFLDWNILGYKSYVSFRIDHAVLKEKIIKPGTPQERKFMVEVEYINTDRILSKVAPFYRRVEKKDCLDLPEKIYKTVEVELPKAQAVAYKSMRDKMVAEVAGKKYKAPIALTKLLRLLQITSGFISQDGVVQYLDSCVKTKAVADIINQHDGKIVVFFCEHAERVLLEKLCQSLDVTYTELHGQMDNDAREASKQAFQNTDKFKVILVQVATGGIGIDLTAADLCIYYRNPHSYKHRKQSEDRLHRPGQTKTCLYVDILATIDGKQTFDHKVKRSLEGVEDLAKLLVKNEDDMAAFLRTL